MPKAAEQRDFVVCFGCHMQSVLRLANEAIEAKRGLITADGSALDEAWKRGDAYAAGLAIIRGNVELLGRDFRDAPCSAHGAR